MALGSPSTACASSAAAGSSTLQVPVGAAGVPRGAAIVVAVSGNSASGAPNGVIDSQGNTYQQVAADTNRTVTVNIFAALNVAALTLANSDWIRGTFSGTVGAKELIARSCTGVMPAGAVDASVTADGGSPPPSSGSSGALQQASEWAVAALSNNAAGGVPSSWTGGFTAVTTQGPGPYLTLADQIVSSQAALTAGATLTSGAWAFALVTLMAATPPPPIIQPPLAAAVHRSYWW